MLRLSACYIRETIGGPLGRLPVHFREWSIITGRGGGGGGYKTGGAWAEGRGASEVLPLQRGEAEKI